jgi:hypothetical protein
MMAAQLAGGSRMHNLAEFWNGTARTIVNPT